MKKDLLWVELGFPSMTSMLKLKGSCHSLEVGEPNGKSLATGREFSLMHYYHSVSTLLRKLKERIDFISRLEGMAYHGRESGVRDERLALQSHSRSREK